MGSVSPSWNRDGRQCRVRGSERYDPVRWEKLGRLFCPTGDFERARHMPIAGHVSGAAQRSDTGHAIVDRFMFYKRNGYGKTVFGLAVPV